MSDRATDARLERIALALESIARDLTKLANPPMMIDLQQLDLSDHRSLGPVRVIHDDGGMP